MTLGDGVLYRHADAKQQLVLSKKLISLVFTELYVKMGYLGQARTLQLIRDRIYWLKMKDDVRHFASKVCSCSEPVTARCCVSIPPENIRKPLGFLMFSGGIEKQHRAVMGESKNPHIVPVATMQYTSSSAPLEFTGLESLHLDTCAGDYQ